MSKKRKLKTLLKRRPENIIKKPDLSKMVADETGFPRVHVDEIIGVLFRTISDKLKENNQVYIHNVGTLYRYIHPERTRQGWNGFEPYDIHCPPQYTIKFKLSETIKKDFDKMNPTKEEVDNLYRD